MRRNAIRGERHFRRVELAVAQHPEKRLLDEELVIDEVVPSGRTLPSASARVRP